MSHSDTDRNLLFGVLALEAHLLDPVRFAEVCTAWSARRDTPLADFLVERGWLSPDDRADLERRLDRELGKHTAGSPASPISVTSTEAAKPFTDPGSPPILPSLSTAAPDSATSSAPCEGAPSGSRQRYVRRRRHARGGLSEVWLAHDANLGRNVALKELRPERAASPALTVRFLQEAQITGQLGHPGIVPIYELVRRPADEGPPFYTMRFLQGRTLKEAGQAYHARRQSGQAGPLELRELLNAFVAVCNAVAYAHSRGVLHRDLKGDNVMLGDFGEVIVLDWGLAKVLNSEGKRTAETTWEEGPIQLDTDDSSAAEGMAPTVLASLHVQGGRAETVQGQIMGTPPYMAPEQAAGRHDQVGRHSDVYGLGAVLYEILTGQPPFQGASTSEILNRVCTEEPIRPRQLVAATPPALEAVCWKALAKKPEDRYESAAALADDVRRWLADEPVTAYPEPWPVRTRRWLSRHRTLVTAASAALVVAVFSLSLLTVLLGAANRRERLARDQARENFRLARDTVEKYCVQVSDDLRLRQEDLRPLRKELLQTAVEFLEKLKDQPGGDADVRRERGRALKQLGFVTNEIGSPEEAIRHDRQARDIWAELARASAAADDQDQLAAVVYHLGRLYSRTGRLPEAETTLQEALAVQRQLAEANADQPRYRAEQAVTLNSLALLYEQMRQNQKAEETHLQALELRQKLCADAPNAVEHQRGLAQAYDNLAIFYRNQGPKRLGQAEETFEKALALHRQILAAQPDDAPSQHELATCLGNLGIVYLYKKERPRAEKAYQEAIDLYRHLVVHNPSVIDYRSALAGDLHNLGNLFRYTHRFDRAEESYKESLALRKTLVEMQPTVPTHQMNLGRSYNNLGLLLEQLGRPEQAREHYRRALDLQKKLVAAHGQNGIYQEDLARSYHNLAKSHGEAGDFAQAESTYQEVVALHRKLIAEQPGETDLVVELAYDHNGLARLMNQKGDAAAALAWAEQAVTALEPVLAKVHNQDDAHLVLSGSYGHRARALTAQRKYAEALRAWDKALEVAPERSRVSHRLGRASTLAQSGQHAQAAAEAEALTKQGKPAGPTLYDAACVLALAAAAAQRDAALSASEQEKKAEEYAARAVALLSQARQMGFFKDKSRVAHLQKDSDLQALRDRADFKRFWDELEAGK